MRCLIVMDLLKQETMLTLIRQLAKVDAIILADKAQVFDDTFGRSAAIGSLLVLVPLAGLVDFAAEKAKVAKAITKLELELAELQKRLENPKAPPEVLAKWQIRITEIQAAMGQLQSA